MKGRTSDPEWPMLPDQAALYRGILANPHADLPRLVYADWLADHGRGERAEFIRVQCALANATPADDAYCDLVEREIELKAILEQELWAEETPGGVRGHYRRGFCGTLQVNTHGVADPVGEFALRVEQAAERNPLDEFLYYAADSSSGCPFLQHPSCRRFASLSLSAGGNDRRSDALIAALADSPHLGNLGRLSLPSLNMSAADFAALTNLPSTPALRSLAVGTEGWSGEGNAALRCATWRERLTHWYLYGPADFFPALADGCAFPNLWRLDIHAALSVELVRLLNTESLYPRLSSLELGRAQTAGSLERGPRLERPLRELILHARAASNLAFPHLLRSPGVRPLRRLQLGGGVSDATVFGELLRDGQLELPELRHLGLSGGFHGHSLQLLAAAPVWGTVTSFTLAGGSEGGTDDWVEFFRAFDAPELRHLALSGPAFQHKGGLALAANRSLANLRVLTLDVGKLSATALRAILTSPQFQNLLVLNLSHTGGKAEYELLADAAVLPNARRIVLRERNLPPAVAEKLRARPGVVIR